MFRLMLMVFGFLLSALWRPDDPPADEKPEDPPPQDDDPPSDEIVVKFKDEDARQEWLDRQFSERYKRKQEQIREEERKRVEAELAEKQAAEKEDWKEHSRILGEKLDTANNRIAELEERAGDTEERDKRIADLEGRLKAFIDPQLDRLPDHWKTLLTKQTLEEQADWLAENSEKIAEPQEPIGSPASPRPPRDNGRATKEADKEAAEAQRARIGARL